jgi:hypothetical protein
MTSLTGNGEQTEARLNHKAKGKKQKAKSNDTCFVTPDSIFAF